MSNVPRRRRWGGIDTQIRRYGDQKCNDWQQPRVFQHDVLEDDWTNYEATAFPAPRCMVSDACPDYKSENDRPVTFNGPSMRGVSRPIGDVAGVSWVVGIFAPLTEPASLHRQQRLKINFGIRNCRAPQ
jgi:hypothetical protein